MQSLSQHEKKILVFTLCLKELKGVGSKTIRDLFKNEKERILNTEIFDAEFAEKLNNKKIIKALNESEDTWEELENQAYDLLELARQQHISILCPIMNAYPKRLLLNANFPPLLFCLGDESLLNEKKVVSIVGTREPSDFGVRMGTRLAELLASEGYAIVSGLAIGSDTVGHTGALNVHGKTIAVLPTPIGSPVYPKENQELAERILSEGGTLVSEYPPGIALEGRQLINNLVARDEWQPGLSDGLIVIESSLSGGTRHAVRHAKETNTPLAVFDYRTRTAVDFDNAEEFGLNASCIQDGSAIPIFAPETIETFKAAMAAYRKTYLDNNSEYKTGQLSLF